MTAELRSVAEFCYSLENSMPDILVCIQESYYLNNLFIAIEINDIDTIRKIYEIAPKIFRLSNPMYYNFTAMNFAVFYRNHEIIRLLHELDFTLIRIEDVFGVTPIKVAISCRYWDVENLLINLDPDLELEY